MDQDKKRKKEKKEKKEGKEEKHRGASTNVFGKYGILRESDQFRKQQEFTLWLLEVKKISPDQLSQNETKKLFLDYMEDYNTATLPHEKCAIRCIFLDWLCHCD